ncbi:MAG: DUF5312 family protein [Spirochaetaceae bacterium]
MSSRFPELVQALPDQERRDLYRRIMKSLSLDYDRTRRIYPAEVQRTQRAELIRRDMERMSFGMRFRVWLRRLFSGKNREDCFLDARLGALRRTLQAAGLHASGTHADGLDPQIAERLFELYRAAYPVIPLFGHLWEKKESLRLIIHRLLEIKIPDAKHSPEDLLPRGDMEDIFIRTQSKEDIRRELLSRLDEYLKSIPEDVYAQIEVGIVPLYYLRDIGLFDFQRFFQQFGYRPGLAPPGGRPNMHRASVKQTLAYLEELYYAVYSALKVPRKFFVHGELLADFAERNSGPTERTDAEQERNAVVAHLEQHLKELHDAVLRFNQRTPLVELIRFHRSDPYYRVMAYAPQLNLREFYNNSMRIEILSRLDEGFAQIRKGVIDRLIAEIFGGDLRHFDFLPEAIPATLRSQGLPPLKHVAALNVIHQYVKHPFKRDLQEFLRVLGRMMPAREKGIANSIVEHSSGLQDVEEKAESLDQGFSPDADSGKIFHRVRYAADSDAVQHRSYRNLVTQTDREVAALIDEGLAHIDGIRSALQELAREVPDALRERYALYDSTSPHQNALEWKLAEESATLSKVHTLITQTMAMEEGM